MRRYSRTMAWLGLAASMLVIWMSGCSDLQEDCNLLVNCPEVKDPPECDGSYISASCDACLRANCCQEVSDCEADEDCWWGCFYGIMPPAPYCTTGDVGELFQAISTCLRADCATACSDTRYCNPVTHVGTLPVCALPGSQCELVFPGMFACTEPYGIPAQLCQPCNFSNGPYCGSGLRCDIGSMKCARYCCTDADCGTGRCELDQNAVFGYSTLNPVDMVGLCMSTTPGAGPACDASAPPPPSGGTCLKSPGP